MCLFLELDEEDLRNLCFGMKVSTIIKMLIGLFTRSYQVKRAISYIKEI
jgi:hypothetical protein